MMTPIATATSADTFERAVRRLLPALHGYARRLTRDGTQSDDLVQETLLRAWAARHRFIPDSNLKAWLFRIEYNCFLSVLRRSWRTVELSPEMAEVRLTTPAMQEEGLLLRDLASALAALPREQAEALALINDERMPYEDAAQRLGIPIGTVKSRTTRGRAAVKKFLSGDDPRRAIPAIPKVEEARAQPPAEAVRASTENSRYLAWKASGQRLIG